MDCREACELMPLSLDGELDARGEAALDEHIAACDSCAVRRQALLATTAAIRRVATYRNAPAPLRANVLAALAVTAGPAQSREARRPAAVARFGWPLLAGSGWVAAACLALTLALVLPDRQTASEVIADELISSHARALLSGHLIDVASSDQHTVKPWFSGKLDFSPPVRDLADQGFPLIGGRLDYVSHRQTAVLVYKRRQHLIDVFVAPADSAARVAPASTIQGFNVWAWTRDGMSFRAVSDVDPAELQRLAGLL